MSARSIRRSHERRLRRSRLLTATGAAIGGSALFASTAQAINFPVSNTNNAGVGSLRAAVLAANGSAGADTISFNAGVSGEITLTTGEIPITDDLTITGPGAGVLSVSGDANNNNVRDFATSNVALGDDRIFRITDPSAPGAPTQRVTITGLTLKEGVADFFSGGSPQHRDGGAIYAEQTYLNLSGVTLTDNVATLDGGAVFVEPEGTAGPEVGGLTVSDSQFLANRTFNVGGAISVRTNRYNDEESRTRIANTQITNNRAGGTDFGAFGYSSFPRGGGVHAKYQADLENVTISANTALTNSGGNIDGRGGGAYLGGGGILENSTVSGNTAGRGGGGLVSQSLRIRSTAITGNTAAANGGGVIAIIDESKYGPSGPTRLDNSTVSGNSATGTGAYEGYAGGILAYGNGASETLVTRNSTIAGNSAARIGGGVVAYNDGEPGEPTVSLRSTIVGDNAAPVGADATSLLEGSMSPATEEPGGIAAGFSLVESPAAGLGLIGDPGPSNLIGVDPQLAPLANNGGPTETHAPALTSPAVDAGTANGFTTDQRGQSRTLDAAATNNPLSDGTDMGALELADPAASGDDPDTAFKKKPKKKLKLKDRKQTAKVKVKFTGTDNSPPAGPLTFECKVDKANFDDCKSPLKLQLDKGKHTVEVRAIDADGQVDASPAKAKIKVKKAKPKK